MEIGLIILQHLRDLLVTKEKFNTCLVIVDDGGGLFPVLALRIVVGGDKGFFLLRPWPSGD